MIPLFKVSMSPEACDEVPKTLASGFITQGPKVEEFEGKLMAAFDFPYILTLNSATSGLTLGIRLYESPDPENNWPGIDKEDDHILSTPLTCTATNWPVFANGMKLRWVDVDPDTCNMNLDDLKQKINKNTKVIIVVHWGGTPIDLERLACILDEKERELGFRPKVIEDCAHAWLSKYNGGWVGTHGNVCVFSLQAIKHFTTGDGGLIFLPSKQLYERAKLLRWYGIDRDKRNYCRKDFRMENDIVEWGYKFHMNDINATIGICNLPHSYHVVAKHRANAHTYNQRLKGLRRISLLKTPELSDSSYWIYTLKVDDVEAFIHHMKERNITASQVHKRNDVHSCVASYACTLPDLDRIDNHYVCIPVGWWLSDDDVRHIVEAVKAYDSI